MATGDTDNMLGKLQGLIPGGWFMRGAIVRNVVLGGLAASLVALYTLLQAVRAQTRLLTSGGWFIDLFAWDFLGERFLRRPKEADSSFLPRVRTELFRERNTRKGITQALVNLTGRAPDIFEPWNTGDCGAIGVGTIALAGQEYIPGNLSGIGVAECGGLGQNLHSGSAGSLSGQSFAGAGCIGSTNYPFTMFITAYRPAGRGIPDVPGLGYAGLGTTGVADNQQTEGRVSDDDIYAAVAETKVAGVTAWTAIKS